MPDATPAAAMMRNDRASAALGMDVLEGGPGHAVVRMTVRDDMTNGFGITHGGLVFALADTAFAVACNETPQITVAQGADITFVSPTRAGQTLTATARQRALYGRNGLYDVTVTDETGALVAEFRGRSRRTTRTISPTTEEEDR